MHCQQNKEFCLRRLIHIIKHFFDLNCSSDLKFQILCLRLLDHKNYFFSQQISTILIRKYQIQLYSFFRSNYCALARDATILFYNIFVERYGCSLEFLHLPVVVRLRCHKQPFWQEIGFQRFCHWRRYGSLVQVFCFYDFLNLKV